jgi:hypothetical protein
VLLDNLLKSFNVILFVETWLSNNVKNNQICDNTKFQIFRYDRPISKGGGLLALVSNSLKPNLVISTEINGAEVLILDISWQNSNYRLILVYIPPKVAKTLNLVQKFLTWLEPFIANNQTIILGDFNLAYSKLNTQIEVMDELIFNYHQFTTCLNLTQIVTSPTRLNETLDWVLSAKDMYITELSVNAPLGNSDHKSISFNIGNSSTTNEDRCYNLDYKNANYDHINQFLTDVQWNTVISIHNNIDQNYVNFLNVIQSCISAFVPKFNQNSNTHKLPLYLQKMINYREKLRNFTHFPKVLKKFAKTENKIKRYIGKLEKSRQNKIFDSSKNKIFSFIRAHSKTKNVYPAIRSDNEIAYNDAQKAAIFANHFSSVYIPNPNQKTFEEVDGFFDHSLIFLTDFEIFDTLNKLQPKFNASPDNLHSYFIKKCAKSLTRPISKLLKISFFTNNVPLLWKEAIVFPLFKSGDKSLTTNYRPIALTSVLAKIAEKFVLKELNLFFQRFDIIPSTQHGFEKNKSVLTNLLETIDDWTKAIDSKKNVDVVFFDFKKAFDSVNIEILLQKLNKKGVTGNCLAWLRDFLTNRKIKVKIGTELSDYQVIRGGVPQGCVLSPQLFNFFISDSTQNFTDPLVTYKFFADDLHAYVEFDESQPMSAKHSLQNFIDHINSWAGENDQKLSSNKMQVLHLGKNNPKMQYNVGDEVINTVQDSVRCLGLHITPNLKWTYHIRMKCTNALKRWFGLTNIVKSNSQNPLITVYKAYVRPILEFPSVIYNSSQAKTVKTLEAVQRKITRHILFKINGKNYSMPTYEQRLKLLKLETLEARRQKLDLIMFHKIKNGLVQINPKNFKKEHSHNIPTRFQQKRTPILGSRLQIRYHSFFVRMPKYYAKLPTKTVNAIPKSTNDHDLENFLL